MFNAHLDDCGRESRMFRSYAALCAAGLAASVLLMGRASLDIVRAERANEILVQAAKPATMVAVLPIGENAPAAQRATALMPERSCRALPTSALPAAAVLGATIIAC